jgi:hypothetical protein
VRRHKTLPNERSAMLGPFASRGDRDSPRTHQQRAIPARRQPTRWRTPPWSE